MICRFAILLITSVLTPLSVLAQTATTNAATNVGDLSATLNGVVNPGGVSNWVYFQFGTTTSYGQAIQALPSDITGFANVSESVVLTGLLPNTTYHFRMGTAPAGMAGRYGADMTFTTGAPATPPSTGSASTSAIYSTLVQVQCPVNSGSSAATVTVEYGPTTSYGSTAVLQSPTVPLSTSNSNAFAQINDLQPGTTYHCRFKAVNDEGTGYSADATFTTLEAPVITTGTVDAVTDLAAAVNGTLDRKGGNYSISVQFGTTTAYGQSAGVGSTTLLTGAQPFSGPIATLLPDTTYHYRIAVSGIFTTTYYGADATFTTAAANTPPEVQPNGVTANTQTPTRTELFLTWLKTGSSPATVSYEYGLTTSYGSVATHPTPRPVNTFQEFYVAPVQLTGLTPGTTYHFRGKAVNAQGTAYTNDFTFTLAAGPVLEIGTATDVTDLNATLNGTVNTHALLLRMAFEYGTSASYGFEEQVPLYQQNTSPATLSVNPPGLQPGTMYHYRLKAVNHYVPSEVFVSSDATFTTAAAATPPLVLGEVSASNVLTRSAQVSCGSIYSGSSTTTVVFQYGTSTAYGTTATYGSTLPLNTIQPVAVNLSGLTPGTTYHVHAVATNAQGSSASSDITFATMAATPPTVGAISAQQVRTTAAVVQAVNVSAGSADAGVVWDYGLTTTYGTSVAANPSTLTTDTSGTVTGLLSGLQPLTTYHYRCRVMSTDGSAMSSDGTFTTAGAPTIVTNAATSVGDLTAILNGSAATTTGDLTAFFELGTTTGYGTIFNPASAIISSATSTPVFASATGLLPNTTYHYRLSVRDQDNNVFSGSDMTFTTAAPATPPTGETTTPVSLSANGATLKAYVSSGSSPATIVFQYGTTTAYGAQLTHATTLATSQYDVITDPLSGLTPATTYHYRVVVTNSEGTSNGFDVTFTTPALPVVTTGIASSIQPVSATLGGSYQAQGGSYTVIFDYGETTAYGLTVSAQGGLTIGGGGIILGGGGLGGGIIIGGGGGIIIGSGTNNVTGLAWTQPQKIYHFRLRLTDSYGNSFPGSDATFTTPAAVEAWRQQHFGSSANTGDAADSANPAGDGIPNLMKYALWMNPTQSGTPPPPTAIMHNGARYLGMSFSRNPNALDVTCEVQAADSPAGPWTTITTIPPGGSPSGPGFMDEQILAVSGGIGSTPTIISDTVHVRDTVRMDAAPRRFLRFHRAMNKLLPLLLLLVVPPAFGQALTAQQQNVLSTAEKSQVEVKLDQPYAGTDNPKQKVDVYLPKKLNGSKLLPVVALIHGGGWMNGDRLGYAAQAIQLARTGDYAAVTVGYRLSKEASWPAQVHDCKAAIRWIRAHAKEYFLDADRIAVWGSSAGGHLSSLLGTSGDVKELEGDLGPNPSFSSRVQCVVNLCGPEDFSQALMFDKEGKPIWQDDAVSGLLGGNAQEKTAEAKAASPVTYVTKDDPPFITFHGTKDMRVAFLHAEALHAALQKAGATSLLVPITDGGHGSVGHPEVKVRGEMFTDKFLHGSEHTIDTTPLQALPEAPKKK